MKINSIDDFKKKYPTTLEIQVAWGEMDPFHHVNNIFYFRYFESVRMHFLGLIGALEHLKSHNIGPILAATDCKFISPITWPDDLIIGTKVESESIGADRFELTYGVWSKKQSKIAAFGSSIIVYYNYFTLSKTHIPESILKSLTSSR